MTENYVPKSVDVTHRRKVGMIIKALTFGPATIHTISARLQYDFKYKHYPNSRAIANYLNKYKILFEIEEKTKKYVIYKLRDGINVMDRKIQTEESE
tara:strand:- start:3098 stop:3388 length:291 start_codon:yes stop_codon:yes gene_type:complete